MLMKAFAVRSLASLLVLLMACPLFGGRPATHPATARKRLQPHDRARAMVVAEGMPLVHTRQFSAATAEAALDELHRVIGPSFIMLKLNVVAASHEEAEKARRAIEERYRVRGAPPVSTVIGKLPGEAAVGIDAVAATKKEVARPDAAVIPPNTPHAYISGQAEKGATPAEAAAATLQSLKRTLHFLGATPEQVVQARCFLTPMSASGAVKAEFEKAFGKENVPPLVFVEWKSQLPVEIEMITIAAATRGPVPPDRPVLEYLTPPGIKPSPLFARVVKVNGGDTIYIGDVAAADAGTGAEQVTSVFDQLEQTLKQTRSDLRHLVKATYYVSDDDASKQLNVLRPMYYDPARPPAASKAMVPAVGAKDRSISIDMIAVRPTPAVKP